MKLAAFWIGCFVCAALALVVIAVLWLGGGTLFDHRIAAVINFHDGVTGLYKGAPVTFRGVPVGEVVAIDLEIDPRSGTVRIPVHILLLEQHVTLIHGTRTVSPLSDLKRAVRDGLRATLVLQSVVTGQKAIDLNILPQAAAVTPASGATASRLSATESNESGMPTEIPVVAGNFAALEDQLADLPLRQLAQELLGTMAAARVTLASANSALGAASITITQAGRQLNTAGQQAGATLADADQALVRIEGTTDRALAALTRLADHADQTASALQPDLLSAMRASREATESARLALARLAELTEPEGPLGNDLRSAVADLALTARSLRDWSDLLDEQPNALVIGRHQTDPGPPR